MVPLHQQLLSGVGLACSPKAVTWGMLLSDQLCDFMCVDMQQGVHLHKTAGVAVDLK